MKILIILFFIILPFNLKGQDSIKPKLTTDNSISGLLNNSNTNSFNFAYNGNNSLTYKNLELNLTNSYSNKFSPTLTQNEYNQRLNASYLYKYFYSFCTQQYNYSLLRKYKYDNLSGFGIGIKKKNGNFKFSLSYALLIQQTKYFNDIYKKGIRQSFRIKYSININKIISISSEYYYQPSIYVNDYIIIGNTKITFKNNKGLSLNFQDNINYNNVSNVKLIHNFNIGIGFSTK